MDMQNVSNLEIPEGEVRTIHDKDNRLIWGRLAYDTKYAGNTTQQTYSGKNLTPYPYYDGTITREGIKYTPNADGSITVDGTWANAGAASSYAMSANSGLTLPAGTYYMMNQPTQITAIIYDGTSYYNFTSANGYKQTFSGPVTVRRFYLQIGAAAPVKSFNNATFYPMLTTMVNPTVADYEPYVGGVPAPNPDYPQDINVVTGTQTVQITAGTESEDFTINLGSTELAKIGNYQDYIYKSGSDWYVHKEVAKIMFNGSENWVAAGNGFMIGYVATSPFYNLLALGTPSYESVCDHFVVQPNGSTWAGRGKCGFNSAGTFWLMHTDTSITTAQQISTWLSSNNTSIYIPIATSTDTQITDSMLIGQLNAVHQWLTRYGYNATVTGNLPIVIDRTNL